MKKSKQLGLSCVEAARGPITIIRSHKKPVLLNLWLSLNFSVQNCKKINFFVQGEVYRNPSYKIIFRFVDFFAVRVFIKNQIIILKMLIRKQHVIWEKSFHQKFLGFSFILFYVIVCYDYNICPFPSPPSEHFHIFFPLLFF